MNQLLDCLHRAHLDQLLAEVIAKLVGHGLRQDVKHAVDESACKGSDPLLGGTILLNLLLDHPATSLIKSKRFNLLGNVDIFCAEPDCQGAWQHLFRATRAAPRRLVVTCRFDGLLVHCGGDEGWNELTDCGGVGV